MQKMLRGGEMRVKDGVRKRSCSSIPPRPTPCVYKNPAGAVWRSLSDGGGVRRAGEEGGKGRKGDSTRQGQSKDRPQAFSGFYVLGAEGAGIVLYCGSSLPHQHTAAVTRGHQQRPVKEKH